MPVRRVVFRCFEDGLGDWQVRVIDQLAARPDVVIEGVVPVRRSQETDFGRSRRSPRVACSLEISAPASGAPDIVINLTAQRADDSAPELFLDFEDRRTPGRNEVRRGAPVSTIQVMLARQGRPDAIMACAALKTASNWRRNADRLFAQAPLLFARAFAALQLDAAPLSPPNAVRAPPLAVRLRRRFERTLEKAFQSTRWTLAILARPPAAILETRTLDGVRRVQGLPPERFHADPFPVKEEGGRLEVLAESAPHDAPTRGRIDRIVIESGAARTVVESLADPCHLSYPFLLREDGVLYCIPERHESGRLSAFRQYGEGWVESTVLLPACAAVDPTLVHWNGRWWLFCCDRAHEDTTHLFVFWAPRWRGPWTPHPLNPVKSDVRSSRPAGAFFSVDGALYRPAQDCSVRYGGAVSIQRVLTLSETDFLEEEAIRIDPRDLGPGIAGVHTLNSIGDTTVIDVLERRWPFP